MSTKVRGGSKLKSSSDPDSRSSPNKMEREEQIVPNHNNNNNIAFFSQASWGRLEMKPERNKFKVQAH